MKKATISSIADVQNFIARIKTSWTFTLRRWNNKILEDSSLIESTAFVLRDWLPRLRPKAQSHEICWCLDAQKTIWIWAQFSCAILEVISSRFWRLPQRLPWRTPFKGSSQCVGWASSMDSSKGRMKAKLDDRDISSAFFHRPTSYTQSSREKRFIPPPIDLVLIQKSTWINVFR